MRFRRAGIIAAVAATLVVGSTISTANGAVPAGNQPPAPVPVAGTPLGGWLTLETGLNNRVSYFPVAGQAAAATQTLIPGVTCTALTTDGSLLGIAGTPGGAALKYGGIGVIGAGSPSKTCSQVGLGESLDLTLTSSALGGSVASAAFLDLEVKGSSRIVATAKLAGETVGTWELQTGSSIGTSTTAIPSSCRTSRDDWGDDDHEDGNCRWAISVPTWAGPDDGIYFDTLSLTVLKGAFALEGGSDPGAPKVTLPAPLPAKASFFELSGELIACGETSDSVGGTNGDALAVFTRLDTNADGSPCKPVAFSLTSEGNNLHFVKPLNIQIAAQYIFTVTWTKTGGLVQQTTPTTIDWESGGGDLEIPPCVDPVVTGGVLTGIATPPVAADDQDPAPLGAAGIQYACIGYSTYTKSGPNTFTGVEQVYLTGDAYMRG